MHTLKSKAKHKMINKLKPVLGKPY